jgi:copper oxidase (laccase) domain-containing protein
MISDYSMQGLKSQQLQARNNLTSFLEKHDLPTTQVTLMEQVHSNNIKVIDKPGFYKNTDGLIVTNPKISIVIYHADCIPLFIYSDMTPIFGGVHAG